MADPLALARQRYEEAKRIEAEAILTWGEWTPESDAARRDTDTALVELTARWILDGGKPTEGAMLARLAIACNDPAYVVNKVSPAPQRVADYIDGVSQEIETTT